MLQNKDKAIIAFSISCTKSKPYVEHCYSLPMIAEIESVLKVFVIESVLKVFGGK